MGLIRPPRSRLDLLENLNLPQEMALYKPVHKDSFIYTQVCLQNVFVYIWERGVACWYGGGVK